jgi:predicted transposase YbfD/YdcC
MESTTFLAGMMLPPTAHVSDPASLYRALQRIPDPRQRRGRRYSLALVLTLMILGKLAGETTVSGIAQWARLRTTWLTEVFALPRPRLPCANTYTLVSNKVDLATLNAVLAEVLVPPLPVLPDPLPPPPPATAPRGQRHLALDGKTLRGTRRCSSTPQSAVHLLELYDVTHQGMLAQIEVATKDHEVPCAAQLIAGCDFAGCVITADALHTQRDWCAQIIAQRGDYVLIVKENQRGLLQELAFLFDGPWPAWLEQRTVTTVNKGHGRLEVRQLRASTEMQEVLGEQWVGLAQVFQLERARVYRGKRTHEVVYGISSLPAGDASAERLLSLVRAHWHLENRVHWRKDVTLGEDANQVRHGRTPQVLAALNNAVLALMDKLKVRNVPMQMRTFAAHPAMALALLMSGP